MADKHRLLYLDRSDIEGLAISMAQVIECTEFALSEKGKGNAIMPAKHWIAPDERRFFSAMSGALTSLNRASCKWQSGSPDNQQHGLPYITGLLILNELATGLPIAVMDSTWITAQRTAAATAVTARHLAKAKPDVLAIIGCGIQGRANVRALRVVFPELAQVQAFDIDPLKLDCYADEISAQHAIAVHKCRTVHDTVQNADIVVTCGPITQHGDHILERHWLAPGALVVTIDYDCYLNTSVINEFDRLFTDDLEQMHHLKAFGFFRAVPDDVTEVGAVVCGRTAGRLFSSQVILSMNMGIAVEDTALAHLIYEQAERQQVGRTLTL